MNHCSTCRQPLIDGPCENCYPEQETEPTTDKEKLEQLRTFVQNEKVYANNLIEQCPLPQTSYEDGIVWLADKILVIINQKGGTQ